MPQDLCCCTFFGFTDPNFEIVNLKLQENASVEKKTGPGTRKNGSVEDQGNIGKAGRGTVGEAQEAATETPLMRNRHHRA